MNKYFLVLLLPLLLSSCASITPQPQKQTRTDHWILHGKIGIQSPKENGSASLVWKQEKNNYHIRLFGPLGIGAVELNGTPSLVTFINNKGEVYQAKSAELLLKQNTGWQIPVSNLVYWVQGIPAPKHNQQDWQIEYLKYQNGLPKLIELNYSQIKLRISIDSLVYS